MHVCHKKPLIFGSLYLLLVFVPWGNSAPAEVTYIHLEDFARLENSTEFGSSELESGNGLVQAQITSLNVKLAMQQRKIDNLEHEVEAESSRISTLSLNLTDTLMAKLLPVWILALHNKVNLDSLETKAEVNGNRSAKNELEIANVKELVGSFHPTDKKHVVPVSTSSLPKSGTLSGPEMAALMKNGTAVLRGADWRWGDQDGGVGSIGRVKVAFEVPPFGLWVAVQWPNGKSFNYRMGSQGYDLRLADEGQLPKTNVTVPAPLLGKVSGTLSGPEMVPLMKIGTAVVRGADWEWEDQDGGAGSIGLVTKDLSPTKWISVKWPNGNENNYQMGAYGKYDLKLADESQLPQTAPTLPAPVLRKTTGTLSGAEMAALMKIGTAVVRGADWSYDDQDGGAGSIGHTTSEIASGWVSVRWTNGNEYSYAMGSLGEYDLKLADEGGSVDSATTSIPEVPRTGTMSGPEIVPLLKIGTAVVRGTDWKWENQDGGAGNIGHITEDLDSDKWIEVKWSNGKHYVYRMGYDGKYDLKLVDEGRPVDSSPKTVPAVPKIGKLSGAEMVPLMKIGTAVVRGDDWSWMWGNQDGGAGSIGHITTDLDSDKWIKVKWSNGKENNYRMGYDGKYDLKLADETTPSDLNV